MLLITAIWIAGGMLDVSTDILFAATIGVLIICLLLLALSFARANQYSAAIEKSIQVQSEQQMMGVRPDKREEIQELKEQLDVAIDSLKKSKLGQGRRGKAALYALPWYVFIGPPTSGKTTAIVNSGLNFPIGMDRIRGVGGTRNCDWFFSDKAIFLDTAGRYITEHEDREEWLSFLDTLKKNRPDKPINGVLVGISMSDLVGKSIDEVERHADKIRRRIDELVGQLDIRFPVYIMFTKMDLIRGFVEFFGAYDSREREQIWGCTLDSEQSDDPNVRSVFEKEFELLQQSITTRRTEYLSRAQKREGRHSVYMFPLEFADARENLGRFITRVFQPNPYQVTPIFRGFYFTSGTQEGIPIEGMINKIADKFGLQPRHGADGHLPVIEKKSYFIKDVFTKVIIPDQYLVSQTPATRFRKRIQKAAFSSGAIALLGLFVLLSSSAFFRSKSKLNETGESITLAANVNWNGRDGAIGNLAGMRELDLQIEELEKWGDVSLINLDRSKSLLDPARAMYRDKARSFVQAVPFETVTNRLSLTLRAQELSTAQQEQLYDDLKTILLMTSESGRLSEEENYRYLLATLKNIATEELQTQLSASGDALLAVQIDEQIKVFMEELKQDPLAAFPTVNQREIRLAQNSLSRAPTVRSLYDRILRQAELEGFPDRSLDEMVGSTYDYLFQSNPTVPGVYTQAAWLQFVEEAIKLESEDPERDNWVAGASSSGSQFSGAAPDQVAAQIEDLYFREYERAWRSFLEEIRYTPANDVRNLYTKLDDLSNPFSSPLLLILENVTNQTTFVTEEQRLGELAENVPGKVAAKAGKAGRAAAQAAAGSLQEEVHPLTERFEDLHSLKAQVNLQEGPLVRVFEQMAQVAAKLDDIGSDRSKAAEYTVAVLTQDGADLEDALFTSKQALRSVSNSIRENLFDQPIEEAWRVILIESRRHLNTLWQDQVYREYQANIEGRYPFNPGSNDDVNLSDFKEFFHPSDGVLATFRTEHLAVFENKSWDGRSIGISRNIGSAYAKAQELAEHLYEGNELAVSFRLQPEQTDRLVTAAPRPSIVSIRIHDQQDYRYDQGGIREWQSHQWPGFIQESVIELDTERGIFEEKEFGEWAWFRLLSMANVSTFRPGQYRVSWDMVESQYRVNYNLQYDDKAELFRDVNRFFVFNLPGTLF